MKILWKPNPLATVAIRGIGIVHNDPPMPNDANILIAEFVEKLSALGHDVRSATITSGDVDDVTFASAYLADIQRPKTP